MPQAIIDSHAHVFVRDLPLASARRYAPDYDATLEQYLALLDEYDIRHGVLVQPSFLGTNNEYLLQALSEAKGRCVGVAVVDPGCGSDYLVTLRDQYVRGVRLNLFGAQDINLRQTCWQQLFSRVKALDMHVELHAPIATLANYIPAIIEHEVDLVIDHFGRPTLDNARTPQATLNTEQFNYLLSLSDSRGVFVKVSAIYRIFSQAQPDTLTALISLFMNTFTSERLMWGSDWPHTQHETRHQFGDSIGWAREYIEDPADRQNIFFSTAASFYKIQGDNK